MNIEHLNPEGMAKNPAFSQAVVVTGAQKLIFVGGQNGVKADGTMAGSTMREQSEQALRNVITALEAAGASRENVTRLGIYMVQGQDVREGFVAAQEVWGLHATAITGFFVASLARPDALVEIEATAVL
ncbi:MAG: RidA family protein [Actinobacteria bacterium]|nr:RidA family protein [Actinomycetota bacterium]